jgi:hypothetical protein
VRLDMSRYLRSDEFADVELTFLHHGLSRLDWKEGPKIIRTLVSTEKTIRICEGELRMLLIWEQTPFVVLHCYCRKCPSRQTATVSCISPEPLVLHAPTFMDSTTGTPNECTDTSVSPRTP